MLLENCSSLTNITIPEGIKKINGGAFWECSSLINISIPNSVTEIDYYTFCEC